MNELEIDLKQSRSLPPPSLSLLAVPVGVVAGIGAVLFRGLIGVFHNLLFLGILSTNYDSNAHTGPFPWGFLVVLVPVAGAVGVAYLVQTFAPEAKGHGVPEVMEAIYYHKGVIRPVVAVIKALASALSIGSGGAVGREGPIIQIGAAFGSTVGQVLRMPVWQRITLIAAGAAGGIAATFNTPIGGVLFALEMILHEISARTLVPVAISTATAAYVGRIFFGDHPSFYIPSLEIPHFRVTAPPELLSYAALGVILGLTATVFIKAIYAFEDFFDQHVPGRYVVRHMFGMFLVGLLMYALMRATGHYYVEGVGYATIQDILDGALVSGSLLAGLFAAKLFATCLTLGSGASGGIFSPSMFIGATLAAAYAIVLNRTFPGIAISPQAFAVAGMAGMIGSTTGAAMAGIVMTFEMTLDYNVIIPTTIVVAISYGIRQLLSEESIYTLKLARRGHRVPLSFQTNFHHLKSVKAIMDPHVGVVPASTSATEFAQMAFRADAPAFFLATSAAGDVLGVLEKGAALRVFPEETGESNVGALVAGRYVTVKEDASFHSVLSAMRSAGATYALVVERAGECKGSSVKGIVASKQLVDSMMDDFELFQD